MFAKKSKPEGEPAERDLAEILAEAVDRNTAVGVVRLGYAGEDPLAQGRLLRWSDGHIVIEELQIIGRDVRLHLGNRVEVYVSYGDVMMIFESKVTEIDKPERLNEHRLVHSMRLSEPRLLRRGDRRSAYRASVGSVLDEVPVKLWFLDRLVEPKDEAGDGDEGSEGAGDIAKNEGEADTRQRKYFTDLIAGRRTSRLIPVDDETGEEPSEIDWTGVIKEAKKGGPHAVGRLVDLSATGIGVLLYGVAKMQLKRFERFAVELELQETEITLIVEMRQATELRGSTCRVGFFVIFPGPGSVRAPERRLIEKVCLEIQRKQIRANCAA